MDSDENDGDADAGLGAEGFHVTTLGGQDTRLGELVPGRVAGQQQVPFSRNNTVTNKMSNRVNKYGLT